MLAQPEIDVFKPAMPLVNSQELPLLFSGHAVNFLMGSLPRYIVEIFRQRFPDYEHRSVRHLTQYFCENSKIASIIKQSPGSSRAFEILYHVEEPERPIDSYFQMCNAGARIYRRLIVLRDELPRIIASILKENSGEKVLIDNLGSGPSHDMFRVLEKHPELTDHVHVRCVDIDPWAIAMGRKIAAEKGLEKCFDFVENDLRKIEPRGAHLLLIIGIFCPLSTAISTRAMRGFKALVRSRGYAVFSTVQETMGRDDPVTDFIMRFTGWHMDYKNAEQSTSIAELAGWEPIRWFDDDMGYNRMTVARLPV